MPKRFVIPFTILVALGCSLFFPLFSWAGFQDSVNAYISQIKKDVSELEEPNSKERITGIYTRILTNLEALFLAIQNYEREMDRKLEEDPDADLPPINIGNTLMERRIEVEKLFEETMERAKSVFGEVQDWWKLASKSDIMLINNVAKMTIKINRRVSAPEITDLADFDEIQDAKDMKSFLKAREEVYYQKNQKLKEWRNWMDKELKPLQTELVLVSQAAAKEKEIKRYVRSMMRRLRKKRERLRRERDTKTKGEGKKERERPYEVIPPRQVKLEEGEDLGKVRLELIRRISSLLSEYQRRFERIKKEILSKDGYEYKFDLSIGRTASVGSMPEFDVSSMGIRELRSCKKKRKFRDYRPLLQRAKSEMEELLREYELKVVPLVSKLKGLGESYPQAERFLGEVQLAIESLDFYITDGYRADLKAFNEFQTACRAEYARRYSMLMAVLSHLRTRYQNILNEQGYILKTIYGYRKVLGSATFPVRMSALQHLQRRVKEMYEKGQGRKVPGFLSAVYHDWAKAYKVIYEVNQHRSLVQARMQDLRTFWSERNPQVRKDYEDLRSIDDRVRTFLDYVKRRYSANYNRILTRIEKLGLGADGGESMLMLALHEIRRFYTQGLPVVSALNTALKEACLANDYTNLVSVQKRLMKTDGDLLADWLPVSYDQSGNPVAAAYAYEDVQKFCSAQEKKRQEETQDVKRPVSYAYDWYDYEPYDVRINGRTYRGQVGDVFLSPQDLLDGEVEISFRIRKTKGVDKMAYSTDGRRTWKGLSISDNPSFSFRPRDGQTYSVYVKFWLDTGQEQEFHLLPYRLVFLEQSYQQQILEVLRSLSEAYEQESLAGLRGYICPDFLGGRSFLERGLRLDFDLFDDIRLKLFVNRIEKRGRYFVCEVHWEKTQVVNKTGKEQRTTGNTTFLFGLDGSKVRLCGMRGNLMFATLSPEIAQASGLPPATVDKIRQAYRKRNPVQPGAGEVLEDGGVEDDTSQSSSSTSLEVNTASIVFPNDNSNNPTIDFTSSGFNVGTPDFEVEINIFFQVPGSSATIQQVNATFDELTQAPESGYSVAAPTMGGMNTGDVFAFITDEGLYGKVEVVNWSDDGTNIHLTLKWAVQPDGSRNLTTD